MRQPTPTYIGNTAELLSRRSTLPKCPCRMPTREEIFQVRPGAQWQAPVQIAQLKGQWVLLPTCGLEHAHLRPQLRVLRLAINTLGYPFLWPTAVLAKEDSRQATLKQLLRAAEQGWGWAEFVGGRWHFEPVALPSRPVWPDATLDELAVAAFPGAVEFLRRQRSGVRQ
jgi:hypothetical protein